jgi:ketosteroid isomerase-like protein
MSQDNVEVVRRGFDALNAGDMDGVRDTYDPDAVMRYHGDWTEPGPFLGRDAIMRQFERLLDSLDEGGSFTLLTDFLDPGDRVFTRFAWRGRGHGPAMDLELSVVYTVRGGRILEADFFRDHAEALRAAGLSE